MCARVRVCAHVSACVCVKEGEEDGYKRAEEHLTVLVCPVRQKTWDFVLMSHTRIVESRDPVMRTSSVGCSAQQYTALRCPW